MSFTKLGWNPPSHATLTHPQPFDRAPYLVALVASSWTTIATTTDLVGSSHTSEGPSTAMRSVVLFLEGLQRLCDDGL